MVCVCVCASVCECVCVCVHVGRVQNSSMNTLSTHHTGNRHHKFNSCYNNTHVSCGSFVALTAFVLTDHEVGDDGVDGEGEDPHDYQISDRLGEEEHGHTIVPTGTLVSGVCVCVWGGGGGGRGGVGR